MTNLRQAAEQALEALQDTCDHLPSRSGVEREVDDAITALQVALAQLKREWFGLTADEIWKCNKAENGSAVEFHICSAHQNVMDFAEAIEAKLKDKNSALYTKLEPIDWEAVAADQAMTIAMMKLEKRDSSSWVDCTDEQLMEEVRRRGFVIRDAQVGKEWVGLTDDEIVDLACSVDSYKGLVQAVEAKLKEKNYG